MSREEALELLILDAIRNIVPAVLHAKESPVHFAFAGEKVLFVSETGREYKRFTDAKKGLDYAVGRLMNP